jgi:hypothetical protein
MKKAALPGESDPHRRDLQERRQADAPSRGRAEGSLRLFNSSLEGKVRRALDLREDARIDEAALKRLLREAVALNRAKTK